MILIISNVPEATLLELKGYDCVQHDNVIVCEDRVKEKLDSLQSIQYIYRLWFSLLKIGNKD